MFCTIIMDAVRCLLYIRLKTGHEPSTNKEGESMKTLFLTLVGLLLTQVSHAAATSMNAGASEKLVFACTSSAYQVSLVEAGNKLYMSLVQDPDSNPKLLGKSKVAPLPSTGLTAAFASHHPSIYAVAQYKEGTVQSVRVQKFGSLKNLNIDCEEQ